MKHILKLLLYLSIILVIFIVIVFTHYNILRYLWINTYPTSNFNSNYNKIPRVNKKGKVIISLTTVPGRINSSKYTIASLLNQTRRVDEIRIYIPLKSSKGEKYIIPKWMISLSKRLKQFNIKRCTKDWGPATKIIPAVLDSKTDGIDSIIYVDDDMIYNKNIIETLISYSNRYPKYAICNQGWSMERWWRKVSEISKCTLHHILKYFPRTNPYHFNFIDVLQGFSGVIIKPSFFKISSLINQEIYPKETFFVDDVYLSGILNDNNIKRISTETQSGIPFWYEFWNGFLFSQSTDSLSSERNHDFRNDRIASKCFKWIKQFNIKL